jgi:hypothetical protein
LENVKGKGEREGIMEEEKKGELKAIYSELRGYLAQAPEIKDEYDIHEESVWTQYNEAVNLLNKISGKIYSRFCIKPEQSPMSTRPSISVVAYRNMLGGLISRLHGEYFAEEPNPLDGVPSTVMTQNQQQYQSVRIQMIIDITDIINEKIDKYEDGSKEKGFFQKLKSSLSSISNVNQLIKTILKLAKDSGLDINEALKIFT